MEESFGIN